jgi:hypothetical protein
VDRLLSERGDGLQLLHLEHVDQLDMAALALIAAANNRFLNF